jgi:hypothetical protein
MLDANMLLIDYEYDVDVKDARLLYSLHMAVIQV